MDYRALGLRVRKQRNILGLTQEQLAEKVGISASFLGHIERGTRIASLDTLVAVCNTLKVSADYLLADSLDNMLNSSMPESLTQPQRTALQEIFRTMQETLEVWNQPDD